MNLTVYNLLARSLAKDLEADQEGPELPYQEVRRQGLSVWRVVRIWVSSMGLCICCNYTYTPFFFSLCHKPRHRVLCGSADYVTL